MNRQWNDWENPGDRDFKWWWIPVGLLVASLVLAFLIMAGQEVWSWFQST